MEKSTKRLLFSFSLLLSVFGHAQEHDFKTFEKNTMEGTKVGVTNTKTGKEVLPAIYDEVGGYSNYRFFVRKNGKSGVVDTTGKVIIPTIYDDGGYIGDRAFFMKGTKWAMFNYEAGVAMTTFVFDDVSGYKSDVATVQIGGKTGYVDKYGKYILQCKFTEGYDCQNGFILVMENSSISTGYEYVTKDRYGNVTSKEDIVKNGKVPIIFNTKGQIIYKGIQGETVKFNNGSSTFIVESYSDGFYHKLVNSQGEEVIPYSNKYKFNIYPEWIEIVANPNSNSSTYGIVSFEGQILLKPTFASISDYRFKNGELCRVTFPNEAFFFIDKKVNCVEFEGVKCPE